MQLHLVHLRRAPQAEERHQLVLAAVARAAPDPADLASTLPSARASLRAGTRVRRHHHFRADALPVLAGGDRFHLQPVVLVATVVAQQSGFAAAGGDQQVGVAVAIEVADGQTPPDPILGEGWAQLGSRFPELAGAVIVEGSELFRVGDAAGRHAAAEDHQTDCQK